VKENLLQNVLHSLEGRKRKSKIHGKSPKLPEGRSNPCPEKNEESHELSYFTRGEKDYSPSRALLVVPGKGPKGQRKGGESSDGRGRLLESTVVCIRYRGLERSP